MTTTTVSGATPAAIKGRSRRPGTEEISVAPFDAIRDSWTIRSASYLLSNGKTEVCSPSLARVTSSKVQSRS